MCRIGRKPTIYIATALILATSVGNSFAPNMIVYMVLRFFIACGGMGAYLIAYVLGELFLFFQLELIANKIMTPYVLDDSLWMHLQTTTLLCLS